MNSSTTRHSQYVPPQAQTFNPADKVTQDFSFSATEIRTDKNLLVGPVARIAPNYVGTYTPVLYAVANVDATTTYMAQYLRIGPTVVVSGKADVNPTLTATSTQVGISLPFPSAFSAAEQCAGTAFSPTIAGMGGAILADTTNDRAQMQFLSSDVNNNAMYYTFTYQVL